MSRLIGPSRGEAAQFGVYVHVPWCRNLCPYCDFPVAVAGERDIPHHDYLAAIMAELDERAADYAGRRLVSIYFGGGTPSLWRGDCLARVIEAITGAFEARPGQLEITIEANPTDCTEKNLPMWRVLGIDRLSIGVQSMDADKLVALGRDHRMGDGAASVRAALTAGFPRVSADVIFGVPGARGRDESSVAGVADLGVGHMSVYELTIEERTAFGRAARQGRLVAVDQDILADMYVAAHRTLTERGYEHYEVSSYARPGQRSVHNQLYWRGVEYLGLGNGAASFRRFHRGGERITNHRSVRRYMRTKGADRIASRDVLDARDVSNDALWLGMRTVDGVPKDAFDELPRVRDWLLGERLATLCNDRICPTLKGFLYCDRIASRVLGAWR
ncbi:MAG: radical SAM family heme chaperone HemW [Proteobacteria bacterium]|nr:radical SAM family heme chaperone HemW [Pseudomonadota bacterium]